jgi:hypothetical protein
MTDRELSPDQVAAWLRSRDGQNWSSRRNSVPEHHWDDSGVFADVLPDGAESWPLARWPRPFSNWSLDD